MRGAVGSTVGVDPDAAINAEVDGDGDAAVHRAAGRGEAGEVRRVLAMLSLHWCAFAIGAFTIILVLVLVLPPL